VIASCRPHPAVRQRDRPGDRRRAQLHLRAPPERADAGNLTNTLEQLGHEVEERTGVTVIVEIDVSLEAALANASAQIVHIVREALSNMERHSGATTCRVLDSPRRRICGHSDRR